MTWDWSITIGLCLIVIGLQLKAKYDLRGK